MLLDILSWFFILAGSGFLVIGGVGLLRLPDVFTRMHAAGMVDTLALTLLIIGMAVQSGLSLVTVKLFLILLFMFFASPTSTHALAKASLDGGVKPKVDEDQRPDDRRLGAEE
ncbi:MAG TPA: monovalent cation/H(+) antiporter subunit G [Rhodospirillales bacterium]|nr:monovalent cation/H(+) antiporter subunit G [Rhodospirillales bacterium]